MSSTNDTEGEFKWDERPSKRRRISQYAQAPSRRQILLEEIDLEISLRQRLAATAQSRLTWALLLQEITNKCQTILDENDDTFRDATLDALTAIEAPCNILFSRNLFPPKVPPLLPSTTQTKDTASSMTPLRPPYTTTVSTRTRSGPRTPLPPTKKLLFLRNASSNPPQMAKLACRDCSRSDFFSLQGLLNHCRLRHHREYGSHDECVQNCVVLVEGEEEQAWVVANGIEVAGISLPGLRRLFEMAVGSGHSLMLPTPIAKVPIDDSEQTSKEGSGTPGVSEETVKQSATPSTEVTRTLGVHEDSPALAHLLGRVPKKRCINVYEEDEAVDIFSLDKHANPNARKVRWRMSYAQRSKVDHANEDPEIANPPIAELANSEKCEPDTPTAVPPSVALGAGSRFHVVSRICVEDRSMFIPQARRSQSNSGHTHRWRLTISSPSYSLPISSVLRKLTISCLSDPPPSTLVDPITLENPPFVITSTTDIPFLVGLTFTWAEAHSANQSPTDQPGASGVNPPTTVEHWVELDPLHLSTPVLGDEQVFDVELDRNTAFLPVREDQREVPWDGTYDSSSPSSLHGVGSVVGAGGSITERVQQISGEPQGRALEKNSGGNDVSDDDLTRGYTLKLKSILHLAPLTLKDTKGRTSAPAHTGTPPSSSTSLSNSKRVPYLLVPSTTHLRNLVHGRRKAVEWARARTLLEAYERHYSHQEPHVSSPSTGEGIQGGDQERGFSYVPLSVGDVYRWLEDQGHFPRDARPRNLSSKPSSEKKATPSVTEGALRSLTGADADNACTASAPADSASVDYCRRCGLHYRFHPRQEDFISGSSSPVLNSNNSKAEASSIRATTDSLVVKQEPVFETIPVNLGPDGGAGACLAFDRSGRIEFPILDVRSLLLDETRTGTESTTGLEKGTSQLLSKRPVHSRSIVYAKSSALSVSLADPKLVQAIQRLASTWRLPHFPLPAPLSIPLKDSISPRSSAITQTSNDNRVYRHMKQTGSNELAALEVPKQEMEIQFGSSALLCLLLRPMAKLLIQSGVDTYRKDESAVGVWESRGEIKANQNTNFVGAMKGKKRRELEVVKEGDGNYRRILTGSHVVRGLMDGGGVDADARRAVLIMLSKLGVPEESKGGEIV